MRMRIFDYNSFLEFKKRIAVAYRLWERSFQKQQDQPSIDWTRQLINCHMFVNIRNQGPLQNILLIALLRMVCKNNRGSPDTPRGFMDHIKAVFEDKCMLELQGNCKHRVVTINGCKTAWMKHQQLHEIGDPPPAEQSDKARY